MSLNGHDLGLALAAAVAGVPPATAVNGIVTADSSAAYWEAIGNALISYFVTNAIVTVHVPILAGTETAHVVATVAADAPGVIS